MKKILEIFSNRQNAISFYRCRLPLVMLSKKYQELQIDSLEFDSESISWNTLISYDILFLKSPYKEQHLKLLKQAKKLGLKIILDFDDYVAGVPGHINGAKEFNDPITQQRIVECIWLADEMWVSTDTLAGALRMLSGKKCTVIKNAYEPLFFHKTPTFNHGKDVMYRGSYVHMADLNMFADDLIEVANKNDSVITFLGQSPLFLKEFKFKEHIDFLPIEDYIEKLPTLTAAINVVLLDSDNIYSMCHSNNAWIEGTYAGAVTLAPDAPEWRMPGIVNYGGDFKEKLNAMITGQYDLESLHQQSWHYIEGYCKLEHTNRLREESIKRLLAL